MANYAVTDWTSDLLSFEAAVAAIETYIETVDDTKTIHKMDVIHQGGTKFKAFVIHNA